MYALYGYGVYGRAALRTCCIITGVLAIVPYHGLIR